MAICAWRAVRNVLAGLACCSLTAAAASAAPINPGFESGLTGWTASGDGTAQILSSLGGLLPVEGSAFALIGNGPSDVNFDGISDSMSLVSDVFVVATGGLLSLSYDFLTAEFTGASADPGRLDSFSIQLIPTIGSPVTLAGGSVAASGFTALAGAPLTSPDGTSFEEHLGLVVVSALVAPGSYSLRFTVNDDGDGGFDSGLMVDNITLAVPEPSALVLFGFGVMALGTKTYQRIRARGAAQGGRAS